MPFLTQSLKPFDFSVFAESSTSSHVGKSHASSSALPFKKGKAEGFDVLTEERF